jgi:hypothetical protein
MRTPFHKGFSTIELLIAFAVATLFLTGAAMLSLGSSGGNNSSGGIASVAFGAQTIGMDTSFSNHGLYQALSQIKDAIASTTEDWNVSPLPWTISDSPNPTGDYRIGYSQANEITDISPCIKFIESTASTTSDNDRPLTFSFGTYVSNIAEALALGGGCDPTPTGEWDNPIDPDWKTSPADIQGTQTSVDAAIINGDLYAFVTTSQTSASQKDDLWIIDLSDIENPDVINSLETGTTTATENTKGLNDIDVVKTSSGTYAYVLQNTNVDQLQAIDVSDPENLSTADITDTISLQTYGVSPGGSNPIPKAITYYDDRLYIGLYTTVGPELLVFDVATDPAHPTFVGSIANSFDHSINDIVVRGDYAYLAIKPGNPPSGNNTKELMIIDVSGNTPTNTGKGYNAQEVANGDTEAATTLYAIGNRLYMGRERVSNSASEKDFYVFDISSSTNPVVKKSVYLNIGTGGGLGTPRVIDLIVHGKVGFFATTDSTKPFQIFDVVSSPSGINVIDPDCSNSINTHKFIEMVYHDDLIIGANANNTEVNIFYDNPNACGT